MGRAVAVQRGEDAVVLRQRPEGLLPRLLVRQARRHLHLPDGDRGPELSRGGRAARRHGGRADAAPSGADGERARRSARACTRCWRWPRASSRRSLHEPSARRRAAISPTGGSIAAAQRAFWLGYAPPDRFALRDALAAKGVDADQMIEAGLLVHGEEIAVPYDRFRDRVMFPIHDRAGKVDRLRRAGDGAGRQGEIPQFAGDRAFPQGLAAVQPPSRAQGGARQGRGSIVVEGYVDVIAMTRGRLPQDRRAARHRADRRPMRAAVGDGRGADPVLRRRQGRAARRPFARSRRRCR